MRLFKKAKSSKNTKPYKVNTGLINGTGIIEEGVVAEKTAINKQFFLGAFTHVQPHVKMQNTFIGRFCRIDENVELGAQMLKKSNFSNHYFAYAENGPYQKNKYFRSLRPRRYFYEHYKYVFVGNDVWIQKNAIIHEGVKIGDGAVVYPNTVVTADVPPYTIVAGNPAQVIGYRFNNEVIEKFLHLKWWKLDLSTIGIHDKDNFIDYESIFKKIENTKPPEKNFLSFHINSYRKTAIPNFSKVAVIGPSHIDLWWDNVNDGVLPQPEFHLFGITGLAPYSAQASHFIEWWTELMGKVIFFVPDFRIGNSIFISEDGQLDGRFIYKPCITAEGDASMRDLIYKQLDMLAKNYGNDVKFIFWCLYGREQINISNRKYMSKNGYKHPTWNYGDLKKTYAENIIDIDEFDVNFAKITEADGTIHPTIEGYGFLSRKLLEIFNHWK